MLKSILFSCSLILCSMVSLSQEVNIIPQPVELIKNPGSFTITPKTLLVVGDKADQPTAAFFNRYLMEHYGFKLAIVNNASTNCIKLKSVQNIEG